MPKIIKKAKKFKSKRRISKPVQKPPFKKPTKVSKIAKSRREISLLRGKPSFLEGPIHKTKIRIIGIGGGGSSIVSEITQRIASSGKKKISFVVANTDLQALKKTSFKALRFRFGQEITFGLGTGMNPELGKIAAQKEKEKITKILEGQDLLILVACLGGGVGSGATPVFAKISKNLGSLTYGIFTLPFKFEGEKKMEIAKNSLRKLRPYLNTMTIIPNERIFKIIDKKTPLTNALSIINKSLAKSLEGLIEMIYQPGLINIDFADLKTILEEKGKIAYLNTIEVEGPNRVQEAVKKLISNPLYPYTISGARGILFNISGESNLKLSEVNQISRTIWELVEGEAKIIFGISESKKQKDKIKITLLATGCKSKTSLFRKRSGRKKIIRKKEKIKTEKIGKKIKIKKTKIKIKAKTPPLTEQNLEAKSPSTTGKVGEGTSPKIRRNALQVRKALKEEEENLLAQEKIWETPAFLRKKKK